MRLGHGVADPLLIKGVAKRPQLVISKALLELLAGGKLVLRCGFGEKVCFDEIFKQDAAAGFDGKPSNLGPNLTFGECQLGLRDIGSIHACHRARGMGGVRAECQRQRNRAGAQGLQGHGWELLASWKIIQCEWTRHTRSHRDPLLGWMNSLGKEDLGNIMTFCGHPSRCSLAILG